MKIKKTHFGKRLAEIRQQKKLSQRDLAKITGISQRMIAHYETKASSIPIEKLAVMAKAMEISLDELVGLKDIKIIKPINETNTALLNKVKKIESLNKSDQKAVMRFINALAKK
jgi:transcriptional regulator with XRE-family HTH domain